jgi:hypothetical protein
MNIKNIQINKYYSYAIWNDEEPIFYKCIGKEDGYFLLQECPYYGYDFDKNPEDVYPWLMQDIDQEDSNLKEIHETQYMIRSIGLLIEKKVLEEVEKAKNL